jgi:hypothetical protein
MARWSQFALSNSPATHSLNLVAVAGAVFFAASIVIIIRLLLKTRPARDPWAGGTIDDGTDVMTAITDPNLPAHGYERPSVQYGPEPDDTIVTGAVIGQDDWQTAMTVPAPPIIPRASGFADAWIAAFERGENLDPDMWSARMLEGAQ